MGRLAIIPARGGSKRVPGKNIKELFGKPVIAHVIETAIQSKLFDEVMVSTDDEKIAEVAKSYGATVPFLRSAKNADDHATLADVLLEVNKVYESKNVVFDTMCCILPTAALITSSKLNEAFEQLQNNGKTAVIPVIKFSYPIQRALKAEADQIMLKDPKYTKTRTQDLTPYYHDSGQFYWIKTASLIEEETIFTAKAGYIELDEVEAQDVDTLEDWKMLEIKYIYLNNKTKPLSYEHGN